MRAVVQQRYGSIDDLRVVEVPSPRVGPDEVLVRVRATSVHPDIWHAVTGLPYISRLLTGGLRRPRNPIPGTDLAGVVEVAGPDQTRFQPGDAVFGEVVTNNQWVNSGTFAEYVSVKADRLEPKPVGLSFEQAAAVPTPALIALANLQAAGPVQPGDRVLINGAGGGVGLFAVQLAKAFGGHVTGVDSAGKLEFLRSLGADEVIDYAQQDFTHGSARYDLIFDVPGNHSFAECRRALSPDGKYVLIGHDHFGTDGHRFTGSLGTMIPLMVRTPFTKELADLDFSRDTHELMSVLVELLAAGRVRPVIDRTYPLEQVPEALHYLLQGTATGRIVITVAAE